uniref:TBC1 domain family member 5-like n=1 Tax=Phallusia mammillata TaxID=59560 RepID=A0A6F9DTT7_9ASCI|nr:TBC1 domain family member 5-like [Phallusia mammillata]
MADGLMENGDQTSNNEQPISVPSNTDTTMSYLKQWKFYFGENESPSNKHDLLQRLRTSAFKESLRSCHFRSICWRVFLGCLPQDLSDWHNAVTQTRDVYHKIKTAHIENSKVKDQGIDIQVENPLSQSTESSWSLFFRNNELKTLIERDVSRTCPELDFYHSAKVHNMMANILFCYAREHEQLSYRQGMHELLAPLIFVLHCDLQGAAHARDMGTLPKIVTDVLSEEYLEHDAYVMFSKVMDATNGWYAVTETPQATPIEDNDDKKDASPIPTIPFQSNENHMPSPPLEITNKLNHIHDKLLGMYDHELYHHLTRLQIIPQVYGLRWVRLLFGREFVLQDLLVLWDALFADSPTLDLVDYIFVAMMFNIREQLLLSDYCSCMQLLMKYPPIEDVYDLVHLAIYFRDPKNNRRPSHTKFRQQALPPIKTDDKFPVKKSKGNSFLPSFKIDNPFSTIGRDIKKALQSPPTRSKQQRKTSGSEEVTFSRDRVTSKSMSRADVNRPKFNALQPIQNNVDLENEICSLRHQIDELQEKCRFCSDKLDANIRLLQHGVVGRRSRTNSEVDVTVSPPQEYDELAASDEETCVAVANLKQIRDILRGSLSMEASPPNSSDMESTLDQLPKPPDALPQHPEPSVKDPLNPVSGVINR